MQTIDTSAARHRKTPEYVPAPGLDPQILAGAIAHLDAILDWHTSGFVHLDRAQLVERVERVREAALAAKLMLTEHRPVWWES